MGLALRGVPEAEARRHSPEWVASMFKQLNAETQAEAEARAEYTTRLERSRASLMGIVINLAVAAAFDESGAAGQALDDLRQQLLADTEEDSLPWLLNPNAQGYDVEAIRAAGVAVQSVPAADANQPQEVAP